jgi:processive 1,2-diacylglycerol beta-glucosyltransferase
MIQLKNQETGGGIGEITETQLQFLVDQLEEESTSDQDYYLDAATIEMLEDAGAEPGLVDLLRKGLGEREGITIRWSRG